MSQNSNVQFTVCALFYGDYPDLARRCLTSLQRYLDGRVADIRIGLNQVCETTEAFVADAVRCGFLRADRVYGSTVNRHKYPVMRDMLYNADDPIQTSHVMWFDDDSYITGQPSAGNLVWLTEVQDAAAECSLLGNIRYIRLRESQKQWVHDQPWYTGQPLTVKANAPVRFVNGGWWVAETAMLRQLDYPWRELDHNGGDVMLGVAVEQQGGRLRQFNQGLAINAGDTGKHDGAPRRGVSQKPIGC